MDKFVTIFMCGDVMTGRGIDQVMTHPSDSKLYEPFMKSAKGYVDLAEDKNGVIQKPVSYAYIWGDALDEMQRMGTDIRIINLETSVTRSNDYWRSKGINYRMHPKNILCLTTAKIDYCSLANNHMLDWGYSGLIETFSTLTKVNIKYSGAGVNIEEAEKPAILDLKGQGRIIIFSYGLFASGIPKNWQATRETPGINTLADLSTESVFQIQNKIKEIKQPKDLVVFSIHWGSNWGYEIPNEQIEFSHTLINDADVDIVHGHSSHHIKRIEVYKDKPIIYGCGDFINDYEGISGREKYRSDLGLMYFIRMDISSRKLIEFHVIPTQIKNFKVNQASPENMQWLYKVLNRESKRLGTHVTMQKDNKLRLVWSSSAR